MALVALVLTIAVTGATAGGPGLGRPVCRAGIDSGSAIVQLNGDPLSTYVKTKPAPGKKIDFSSNTVKSYRAQLSALRNDFKQWLKANAPDSEGDGRVRHRPERGRGSAERDVVVHDPERPRW